MILNEKGAQAKTFAENLGGKSGFLPNGDSYDIVHASGHLLELKKPQENVDDSLADKYNDWQSLDSYPWNIHDFKWKYQIKKSGGKKDFAYRKDLLNKIKQTSIGQDGIVIATDDDPSGEGDVLGWEIINWLNWQGKVYRIRFDSEEKPALLKAFKEISDGRNKENQAVYHAGLARSWFDYLSQQLSPIASINAWNQGYQTDALRLGRFKSVINEIVWYQNKLRNDYKKKPFYEVRYQDENQNIFKRDSDNNSEYRFDRKADAETDLENFQDAKVEIVKQEIKKQQPPALLSLSDLNVLISKEGYSDEQFLKTYQKMYEAKIVSYPRTDDTKITQDQYDALLANLDKIAKLVNIDVSLLTHKTLRKKHKIKHADHGANRPWYGVPKSLDKIEAKYGKIGRLIYEYLARATLAIFCEDYVYQQESAQLVNYPAFKATINQPKELNYKKVFNESSLKDTSKEDKKKSFSDSAKAFVYQGANQKPAKASKSFINSFLKKHNLGTGATRVSAMKELSEGNKSSMKLTKDGYILNQNGTLSALLTQKAYISNVRVTASLDEYLKKVKRSEVNWKNVPPLMTKLVVHDMPIIAANAQSLKQDKELQVLASQANSNYQKKEHAKGTWNGKDVKISNEWGGHQFSSTELEELFNGNEISFTANKKDEGTFKAAGKLYEQTASVMKNGRKTKIKYLGFALTPKEIVADEKHFVGMYKKKKVKVNKYFGGYKFTDSEQKELLAGKEIEIEATSSKGKPYTAKGKLGYKTYKGKKFLAFKAKFN